MRARRDVSNNLLRLHVAAARTAVVVCVLAGWAAAGQAQISLASAVDLAVRTSPKVKMADADLKRARAQLSEAHDAFIPAVSANGGVGRSDGVPLGLPVIFSISSQSLVFNFSQRDYIRSAHAGVDAATLAMQQEQNDVAVDAANTYLALDNAQQRRSVIDQEYGYASRLVTIVQERFDAGQDAHSELTIAKRNQAEIHLQQILIEDDIANLSDHLGRLMGLTGSRPRTVHASIPPFAAPTEGSSRLQPDSDGVKSSYANARARQFTAFGDSRYRLRPQMSFSAEYSRVSTAFTNYDVYYPGFSGHSSNSLALSIQVVLPIFDRGHDARAAISAADASHARAQAEDARNGFLENRVRLQHSTRELEARMQIASLNRDLAQDEIDRILIELKSGTGNLDAPQLTPKEEQNARLQERERTVDMLNAELTLHQTELNLLQQNGELKAWLRGAVDGPPPPQRESSTPSTILHAVPAPAQP